MVAPAEIERFRTANATLSQLVAGELESFFGSLNLSRPDLARNALLEFVPLLVDQYGPVAATLAADWYDETRAASGAARAFRAQVEKSAIPASAVESKVRYLAGHLWTPTPESMLGGLLLAADKYVKQPGRDTIASNAKREGVRWARVPTGAKTCAFCLLLASRDAAYHSKQSAGGNGNRFHGACDCVITRIAKGDEYPHGYLPNDAYDMYQTARDHSGSNDIRDIASSMRELYPDHLSDGLVSHSH